MADWLVIALVLIALVWFTAPQQLLVSLYKLSLVSLAAVAGYWVDRSLFPYARPDSLLTLSMDDDADEEPDPEGITLLSSGPDDTLLRLAGMAMLRRAIIVAATMLAVGLGA